VKFRVEHGNIHYCILHDLYILSIIAD